MACCPGDIKRRCETLMDEDKDWEERPAYAAGFKGIYVIKDKGTVIYVGHSGDIRDRLNAHFNQSGTQAIHKYLQECSDDYKKKHIRVNWIEDKNHAKTEDCYLSVIEDRQGRPKYNKKKGNGCGCKKNDK